MASLVCDLLGYTFLFRTQESWSILAITGDFSQPSNLVYAFMTHRHKVLLEHSLIHWFINYLCLFSYYNCSAEQLQQSPYGSKASSIYYLTCCKNVYWHLLCGIQNAVSINATCIKQMWP